MIFFTHEVLLEPIGVTEPDMSWVEYKRKLSRSRKLVRRRLSDALLCGYTERTARGSHKVTLDGPTTETDAVTTRSLTVPKGRPLGTGTLTCHGSSEPTRLPESRDDDTESDERVFLGAHIGEPSNSTIG